MFYFIRTVILYLCFFVGISLGVQYAVGHHFLKAHEKKGADVQPMSLSLAIRNIQTHQRITKTGLFLSGMAAQHRRDWNGAWQNFSSLYERFENDSDTALKAFTLALNNGEYKRASQTAHSIRSNYLDKKEGQSKPESYDLVRLFHVLQAIKSNDSDAVKDGLKQLKGRTLAQFALPVIEAWTDPESLSDKSNNLEKTQLYFKALAAEFHQKPDIASSIMKKIESSVVGFKQIELVVAFYMRQGDIDKATSFLKKAMVHSPRDNEVRDLLTLIKENPKDYKADIFTSYPLNGVNAGIAMAFHDFARAMFVERAVDSALIFSQMAAYLDSKTPSVYATIGDVFKYQNQDDRALIAYNRVLQGDPRYEDVLTSQAEILVDRNEIDSAIRILKAAIKKDGDNAYLHYVLANIYKDDKNYDTAISYYDAAESLGLHDGKLNKKLWPLYYSRAIAFDLTDRWDDAEKDLLVAMQKFPNSPIILNYLGYAYADKGINLEKAKEMISQAVMSAPNDGYIIDSMGWILYRTGDYWEAVKYLERAARLRPYHMVINDHLGDAYWKVGRKLEAQYMWQRAIDYYDEVDEEQRRMINKTRHKIEHGLDL